MSQHTENTTSRKLTDLNADCFRHICSFLDTSDLLRLALVCDKVIVKKLNWYHLVHNYTKNEIRTILSGIGDTLQTIEYTIRDKGSSQLELKDFNSFMDEFCPSVSLAVHTFFRNTCLSDQDSQFLLPLKCLTKLTFFSVAHITGNHLYQLKNLTDLNLYDCANFESENFIKICNVNKLKILCVRKCQKIDDIAIQKIFTTQTELEELKLESERLNEVRISDCQLRKLRLLNVKGKVTLKMSTEGAIAKFDSIKTLALDAERSKCLPEIRLEIFKSEALETLSAEITTNVAVNRELITQLGSDCTCTSINALCMPDFRNLPIKCILAIVHCMKTLDFPEFSRFLMDITLLQKIADILKKEELSNALEIHARFDASRRKYNKYARDELTSSFDLTVKKTRF